MRNELRKLSAVQWLLWLALILALVGSLRHVAWTFTSIDGVEFWGLLQALAVDVGLFTLALGIAQRRGKHLPTFWLWCGVVLFSAISIYANLAYGLRFVLNTLPAWIDNTRPYVLAATLPVLVLYLAEIVGGAGVQSLDQQSEQSIESVQHILTPTFRQQQIVEIYREQPDISVTALAEQLNTSRGTIYKDLDTLINRGTIARNGRGYKVNREGT